MKRICLFAGYSSKGIIEDYTLYYMQELSKISDVYYLADNIILPEEIEKITPYVKDAYGYIHGKYDFGSWQELINIISWEKISEYDELILTNDSVFGPLYNFNDFIEGIEKDKEWDLCGINTAYDFHTWHLSSYFLICRKNCFLSDIFKEHINSVKKEDNVKKVIEKYEIGLSQKMVEAGFILKNAVKFRKNIYISWRSFVLSGSPLIKRKIFSDELFLICRTLNWENFLKKHTKYNTSLIYTYVNQFKRRFRIFRLINNKIFWQYAGKGIIKIIWTKERKLIRIFGIYLLNIYNYDSNKIKLVEK
ncbi:MAG: rhamnan synthesis F family protein [Mucispirillum sp.]|nr:rhamnan synthesis F family protein [Mucispirillum sp.]